MKPPETATPEPEAPDTPAITSASDPLWYKDAVIYQVHVRGFFDRNDDGIGDFPGLTAKLDYIQSLNVSCIWLQPFYPSPLRDDGYDIAHYQGVHPSYGTRRDFRHFLDQAHARGIRVITELVINHTSDRHPWFQAARRARPGSSKRNFYVWSDTDQRYPGVRIIFTDAERSNWTWDPVANAYYWHRFFHHQPDLNFDNPVVRKAVQKVMRFWLDQGVDGMRLDAVPYLIERDGTNCENLPETHEVLREIRRELEARYPDRMLLAEANQWPADVRAYFGDADECHMAFHFPLMPRLFMALQQEDRHPINEIINQTPDIPATCQWAIFLRNHDELTLEMVTDEERDYMYQAYAADPQMRLNLGIRRRLAPLMENSRPRIELMTALLLSMPGTPILYYGDEIGMGDNIYLGDRNGVRTPMQWTADRNAGFSRADPARLYAPIIMDSVYGHQAVNVEAQDRSPHSLLNWTRRMVALRQQHRTFGRGSVEMLRADNRRVLAYLRQYGEDDPILVVANLSRTVQAGSLDLSRFVGLVPVEMSGGSHLPRITDAPYTLTLGPYGWYWLILKREAPSAITVRSSAPTSAIRIDESPLLVGSDWIRLLATSAREILERRYLLPFLRRQRWFGHDDAAATVRIVDWGVMRDGQEPILLTLLSVRSAGATDELYLAPLSMAVGAKSDAVQRESPDAVVARLGGAKTGVLHGAIDADIARVLLAMFEGNQTVVCRHGSAAAARGPAFAKAVEGDAASLEPSGATLDQSNSSIRFGEKLILKLLRRISIGINPEVEIGRFLSDEAGFTRVPRLAGSIEYTSSAGEIATIAVMHERVVHQSDGWQNALDVIKRYFERALGWKVPSPQIEGITNLWSARIPEEARTTVGGYIETAAMIGRRTAELHRALASPEAEARLGSGTLNKERASELGAALLDEAAELRTALERLPDGTPPEATAMAQTVLDRYGEIIDAINQSVSGLPDGLLLTRIHGDFHLGQVLLHEEDAFFVDFEGEPTRSIDERRRVQSPLKDVAGMVRSFCYAAGAGLAVQPGVTGAELERLRLWARWWQTWSIASFLAAYCSTAAGARFFPSDPIVLDRVLRVFLIEKTLYETLYELAHRPSWLSIPLSGLLDLIGHAPATTHPPQAADDGLEG
jgi:maltose alpha-D-glucosyltransferase / alpha-amylase